MSGNVWEWTSSPWRENYEDPVLVAKGSDNGSRVARGGAFDLGASYARCACRGGDHPLSCHVSVGFRVALAPFSVP